MRKCSLLSWITLCLFGTFIRMHIPFHTSLYIKVKGAFLIISALFRTLYFIQESQEMEHAAWVMPVCLHPSQLHWMHQAKPCPMKIWLQWGTHQDWRHAGQRETQERMMKWRWDPSTRPFSINNVSRPQKIKITGVHHCGHFTGSSVSWVGCQCSQEACRSHSDRSWN